MTYVAQPIAGYKAQVNVPSGSTAGTDLVLTDAGDHATFTVAFTDAHSCLDRAVAPTVQTSIDNGATWSSTLSSTTYTLRNLTAQVVLNTPLSAGTTYKVRLHTYNYYPYQAVGTAYDVSGTITTQMHDSTNLQGASGTGCTNTTPGLSSGQFQAKTWQPDSGAALYLAHLLARDLLIFFLWDGNGINAMACYVYLAQTSWQSSVSALAGEDLSFTSDSIISLI